MTDKAERAAGNGTGVVPEASPGHALARLLWTRRRFLFHAGIAGLLAGTLIAFLTPKEYRSSASLMPPDTSAGSPMTTLTTMASMSGASSEALDLLPLKSTGAIFLGILRSRTVQDRLVDRLNLQTVYRARLRVDARSKLQENTEITEDRRAGIITVTVTDRDPKRAAAMARAYVEELDRLVAELNTSAAHRERVFVEGQLREVKQDLDDASRQLSEFSSKNATLDIKDQGRAMVEAAATLQGQLIASESELRGLQQIYTDENVRVRAAKARIGELRAQLQKLGGTASNSDPDANQEEKSLYPSLRRLPLLGYTYEDLYRRTKIQETAYEMLTKQYELAKVEEAKEVPSVRVLDAPEVPERKTAPKRLIIMLVSAFLASALAAAWTVGQARWMEADPHDPTKVLLQEMFAEIRRASASRASNGFSRYLRWATFWRREPDGAQAGDRPTDVT